MVTQSGTNALHGTLFEFLRNSALDSRNLFAQGSSASPFRQNQFGGALGGPIAKDRWFLFGNYEGFRQAMAVGNVSVVPDAKVRLGILPPNAITGVFTPNPAMLPYFSFWPHPMARSCCPTASRAAQHSPTTIPSSPSAKISAPPDDYTLGNRDSLSAAYTIDDGNSLIPLADPLFASYNAAHAGGQPAGDPHLFAQHAEHGPRRLLARRIQSRFVPAGAVPSQPRFRPAKGPAASSSTAESPPPVLSGITSAGPNNAAGVWNRRNLFTFTDDVQIIEGHSPDQRRRVVSARAIQSNSSLLASFPPSLSFVAGEGPGGIVINGGVTTTGTSSITSAGPNNAAGVWNRRNLFTFADDFQLVKRSHRIGFGVLAAAAAGQRGLRLAPARPGDLRQPANLFARDGQLVSSGA